MQQTTRARGGSTKCTTPAACDVSVSEERAFGGHRMLDCAGSCNSWRKDTRQDTVLQHVVLVLHSKQTSCGLALTSAAKAGNAALMRYASASKQPHSPLVCVLLFHCQRCKTTAHSLISMIHSSKRQAEAYARPPPARQCPQAACCSPWRSCLPCLCVHTLLKLQPKPSAAAPPAAVAGCHHWRCCGVLWCAAPLSGPHCCPCQHKTTACAASQHLQQQQPAAAWV